MILGIDVGGTHTDAVLLNKDGLLASAKVTTQHDNLLASVRSALAEVIKDQDGTKVKRFNLSTTLCTNAIVQGDLEEVGVLVSAGPGIDPEHFRIGSCYSVVPGGLDHRGTELKPLDLEMARSKIAEYIQRGVRIFSLVGKFSPRNPAHENQLAELLGNECTFLTLGHTLSGQLNFPRRIATSYYNSAIWPIFNDFANSVADSLADFGLHPPHVNILKADGGTMTFTQARQTPVESIFSGPSASVMGIMALCPIESDAILLDMGGTTTDVAVFADGDPLIEAESVELAHRPTLVRAMKTKSIPLGGDSAVSADQGGVCVGPKRMGPCMAQGGTYPTLVDALNCAKQYAYGQTQASDQGMETLGRELGWSSGHVSWQVIHEFCRVLKQETLDMLAEINERPVYTVHEFLEYRQIVPKRIYLMGGPAQVMAPFVSQAFGLPVVVPDNYAVANALGAALARPTMQAELFADTEKRTMNIPVLGINERVGDQYALTQARDDVVRHLCTYLTNHLDWRVPQSEVEVVEESAMNMVKDVYHVGQDLRVKCQIKPGISPDYQHAVRCLCKEQ
ncbi:hydantoinase/oxoprolinase family protein [Desulfovermiculus halophilus]|uniref:hydantoinase/oxoprolinase family protein n=1 Tax=Desulfovermiculus halophilus TaxID=339722 RepID=UPI0004899009|nr:hydantoinase/oxoprolinase family protein [Desulfovermiculus halophilus]